MQRPIDAEDVPVLVLAEDHEDVRVLYAETLRAAGFLVEEARDGAEAVEVAARLRPNLVFMDLSMPGLDGWDAARQIRAADPRPNLYLIVVSAMTGPESRELAFRSGFDDFIGKPCEPAMLVAVARAFLAGRKSAEGPAQP